MKPTTPKPATNSSPSASPSAPTDFDVLLTSREVALLLRISMRTFWRWVRRGVVPPPLRFNQRIYRWRRRAIEALCADKK